MENIIKEVLVNDEGQAVGVSSLTKEQFKVLDECLNVDWDVLIREEKITSENFDEFYNHILTSNFCDERKKILEVITLVDS